MIVSEDIIANTATCSQPQIDWNTQLTITGMTSGKSVPYYRKKWWGYELTYINERDSYCQKLLYLKDGGHTSLHFHVEKSETLLVVEGILTLEYIENKETYIVKLNPGEAWVVNPGFVHKLIAANGDVTLVECSTYDADDDSVRIS